MNTISITNEIPVKGSYDVIVAGGGVAGVAAAVSSARMGKKTLLIEKTISLGGLATIGLINLFVPMCNGRGTQIIKGMAEEFLRLSVKYGYDTIPEQWKDPSGKKSGGERYFTRFSPAIFSLALTELIENEGVDILYDTIVSEPVTEKGHCKGLVLESKSGREYYEGKIIVDTTGDADILYRAGVPTQQGGNFFTMCSLGTDIEACKKTADTKDMRYLMSYYFGGKADLYGGNHPEDMPKFTGTTKESVTDFVVKNHIETLNAIKPINRRERDIVMLPSMAQFRTTRTIIGDEMFDKANAFTHSNTSIGAICDFDHRDYLFEVPYGTLVKTGFDNLITAGRTACAKRDYSWDILRVIPPAIITGQAAGIAASIAIDTQKPIYGIDVPSLQKELEKQDVMIHFDDSLIPEKLENNDPCEGLNHF